MNTTRAAQRCLPLALFALLTIPYLESFAEASTFPTAGDRTIRMVVLGDSIMWGQGLQEPDKSHSLVADWLRECGGGLTVEIVNRAHSGAQIGEGGSTKTNRIFAEVPSGTPTILVQVDDFNDSPETVDVVLISGGLNDVGFMNILDPFAPPEELRDSIRARCFRDMLVQLESVRDKFTNAHVVVCGYYPIVSDETDLISATLLLTWAGVIRDGVFPGGLAGIVTPFILGKLAENSALFASESRRQLRAAVRQIDDSLAAQGDTRRVFFADPEFRAEHAVFAPQSRLFGVGLLQEPIDPMAESRRQFCDTNGITGFDRFFNEHASLAHPNEAGSRAYARAIFDALTTGGKGFVWADFSVPCTSVGDCGNGTFESPWGSLRFAITYVPEGGTIRIKPSSEPGAWTLSKACVIEACGGSATIGR